MDWKYFAGSVGFSIIPEAILEAEKYRCLGSLKYDLAGLILTLKGYSINCKITLDGKEMYDGPSPYISCANE